MSTLATTTREHYCTLFDSDFLPLGLALHASLMRHDPTAMLWVLCLDELTERTLKAVELPNVRTIRLGDIENDALMRARAERTLREYYWTLTPWMFDAVFDRAADAQRVTYVDADLFFFQNPGVLLSAMDRQHEALITHHAYAPQYDYSETSGEFCVQLISVRRTAAALAAVRWWRDRCLEWCYARVEDGRFGDQRYLEAWPRMLGDRLLIIKRPELTGAPWNACLAEGVQATRWVPVFYHFHGFRLLSNGRAFLVPLDPPYEIGPKTSALYRQYICAIRESNRLLRRAGVRIAGSPTPSGFEDFDPWPTILRRFARLLRRRLQPIGRKPIVSVR